MSNLRSGHLVTQSQLRMLYLLPVEIADLDGHDWRVVRALKEKGLVTIGDDSANITDTGEKVLGKWEPK